jgi:diadenosine tetraphosphatase ApaH/serine/threonine PP2A family protein phosphatase
MRVAVVSDVHGNLAALEAVLAAVADECDEVWCLGDIVGYGARPNECIALVRERCARILAGNHDLAAAGAVDIRVFSPDAARSIRWTREVLRADGEQYLLALVPTDTAAPGAGLYHGSPRDPVWEYVLDAHAVVAALEHAAERVVLVGHTHAAIAAGLTDGRLNGGNAPAGTALDLRASERALLNPGSVGQPRDGDPRAAYLLLDLEEELVVRAEFHRTEYDIARTQAEIRGAGLPDRLADRLAAGA